MFNKDYKAYIFDMDGTLVDSKLNFTELKREIGMNHDDDILLTLETYDEDKLKFAMEVIHKHERRGVQESELFLGTKELLELLKSQDKIIGIVTRNSTHSTDLTLKKHNLKLDFVITREDFPPKPSPDGLFHIQSKYNLELHEMIYFGDHISDIEYAQNANIDSVLVSHDKEAKNLGQTYFLNSFLPMIK